MSDPAPKVRSKFRLQDRYANYGAIVRALAISGFRGIKDLRIDFEHPITALTGSNGSGKSTVLQLLACAYRKPTTATLYKRFYVRDMFPYSAVDPAPFDAEAKIVYAYESDDPLKPQEVTVSRTAKDWSGYKRQPERQVLYLGFSLYIPKVERRDLSVYWAASLKLGNRKAVPKEAHQAFARILGHPYDEVCLQEIAARNKSASVGVAGRYGHRYSENNMGFGEARIFYILDQFESAPNQSLFLLEEPETSLHEDAQHQLARYLIDVCDRRNHQIVLSTHSDVLLKALPLESRKLLVRDGTGVSCLDRISATRARSVLSRGQQPGLLVCVEDTFAAQMTRELLRLTDPRLLDCVQVEPIGDDKAVRQAVALLRRVGTNAMAFLDGDKKPQPAEAVFTLPGPLAPEKEVFGSNTVMETLAQHSGIDCTKVLALNPGADHHEYGALIADEAHMELVAVNSVAIREYVRSLSPEAVKTAVKPIVERV